MASSIAEADRHDLLLRTKQFALAVISVCAKLPTNTVATVLCRQLVRSATSVGANYREARRGRSKAEFISKLEIAQQELAETEYWLELITDSKLIEAKMTADLRMEAKELMAIFIASLRTAKSQYVKPAGRTPPTQ